MSALRSNGYREATTRPAPVRRPEVLAHSEQERVEHCAGFTEDYREWLADITEFCREWRDAN